MLLKDIPGVLPALEDSSIAKSKFWSCEVKDVIPHQLKACTWLAKEAGNESADDEVVFLVNHARLAAADGLIPTDTPILSYSTVNKQAITSTELESGLKSMPGDMARAVIFGLEMDMSLDRLMTLSHAQAHDMEMSELARSALRDNVRSISSDLAFWQAQGEHNPLFGFAGEVYAAFDMSWNTLRLSYKNLIPDHYPQAVN